MDDNFCFSWRGVTCVCIREPGESVRLFPCRHHALLGLPEFVSDACPACRVCRIRRAGGAFS